MNIEILTWENKFTGETRQEERLQLGLHIWQSKTDGRYYTRGIIGWYDITDNISKYPLLKHHLTKQIA